MSRTFLASLLVLACMTGVLACGSSKSKWQKVEGGIERYACTTTSCISTHQGEHAITKANVYVDNDTLFILFPPQMPAYWGCMTIKVHNGLFTAQADGTPFIPGKLRYETRSQQLVLEKDRYALNDTLRAYCHITYREYDEARGVFADVYLKGSIREVVRSKDFDPFASENFLQFDMATAIRELGYPLYEEEFNTCGLSEFRVELLNQFPATADITIRELTWNSSSDRAVSDGGADRLTVWYHSKDGVSWLPVGYIKWQADAQY